MIIRGDNAHIRSAAGQMLRRLVLCLALMAFQTGIAAGAEVLDDSLSPRKTVNVQLEWTHQGNLSDMSRRQMLSLTGRVSEVKVRLDTSKYVGTTARIFLALPVQIDGLVGSEGLTLSWKTQGFFSNGTTTPGNRALIFEGPINSPVLTDYFSFTIHVDAGRLNGNLRYAPIYEIETN